MLSLLFFMPRRILLKINLSPSYIYIYIYIYIKLSQTKNKCIFNWFLRLRSSYRFIKIFTDSNLSSVEDTNEYKQAAFSFPVHGRSPLT